jgi:hypothetical protein
MRHLLSLEIPARRNSTRNEERSSTAAFLIVAIILARNFMGITYLLRLQSSDHRCIFRQ